MTSSQSVWSRLWVLNQAVPPSMSVLFHLLQVKKFHITSAQSFPIPRWWLVKSLVPGTVCSASGPRGPPAPTRAPAETPRALRAGAGPSWPFQLRVSAEHFWIITVPLVLWLPFLRQELIPVPQESGTILNACLCQKTKRSWWAGVHVSLGEILSLLKTIYFSLWIAVCWGPVWVWIWFWRASFSTS